MCEVGRDDEAREAVPAELAGGRWKYIAGGRGQGEGRGESDGALQCAGW
jgi:hypothetical protein